MLVRDLTPKIKREIVMDEPRGRRYGTTRMRETNGQVRVIRTPADPREPNQVGPWTVVMDSLDRPTHPERPFDILRSSPVQPRPSRPAREPGRAMGARIYDARIDAYVAQPKVSVPSECKAPKMTVPPYSENGPAYWVIDRSTGLRMHRFCAQTSARAQQIANDYALLNGGRHGDAYAKLED